MEHYELDMYCHGMSKYKEAVVTYVAGYVVITVEYKIHCEVCLDVLTGSLEENVRSHTSQEAEDIEKSYHSVR